MRLRTTIAMLRAGGPTIAFQSPSHEPDRHHDDDDRHQLQHDAQPHQLLRRIGRTAPQHVGEPEDEHESDGADGDRYGVQGEKVGHDILLAFGGASRYHGGTILRVPPSLGDAYARETFTAPSTH